MHHILSLFICSVTRSYIRYLRWCIHFCRTFIYKCKRVLVFNIKENLFFIWNVPVLIHSVLDWLRRHTGTLSFSSISTCKMIVDKTESIIQILLSITRFISTIDILHQGNALTNSILFLIDFLITNSANRIRQPNEFYTWNMGFLNYICV